MTSPFPVPEAADKKSAQEKSEARRARSDILLDGLNDAQRAAVSHPGGPLLVVAGAGSGKTRVLTRRVAWLIAARGAHPGSILAITFTNKAAAEMRERVAELVGPRARLMWVSTFHSACVRILRREASKFGFTSSFTIYDTADQRRLMTQVCRDMDLDPKRVNPRAVLNWISNLKNELVDHEAAGSKAENPTEELYAEAYATYQARLRAANAMDFDDLIMNTVHLFQAWPDVAETYRRRFRHVLVDEYQDTNHAQYQLIKELTDAESDLLVVGDSDQSIYAFRGANIRNILEFEDDFPNATTILLEQNYRSTQTILSAANAVISRNEGRKDKQLWSAEGDGEKIVGYVGDDERDEAQFIAEEIDKLSDAGDAAAKDVAIFYRTNAQSRVFEEVFIRVGLPYRVVGGVRFYERKEIKDALAYVRVLVNPRDAVSLRRILNEPKRGIGDRAEASIQRLADRRGHQLLGGADPRGGGHRPGDPVAQRDPDVRGDDVGADGDGRERCTGRRRPRGGADPQRLSRKPRAEHRSAGRDPGREPRRARRGGSRVRGRRQHGRRASRSEDATRQPISHRARWRRSSSRSRWSPTPTRSPTRAMASSR